MGTYPLKDVYDMENIKNIVDTLKYLPRPLPVPFPDPIGPVKYDAIDWIVRSYLETLPAINQRIEKIEEHLEQGLPEGKPFIRPQERPSVGDESLQQLADSIVRLNERLDSIEKKLK